MERCISRILLKTILKTMTGLLGTAGLLLFIQPVTVAQSLQFASVSAPAEIDSGQRRAESSAVLSEACAPYAGLMALVPQPRVTVWSQTAAEKPTFFFQVPADLNNSIPLTFMVQDENENEVFVRRFRLRTAAGVLAIPVRGDGLSVGENYRWTFAIGCDDAQADIAVSGTVRRVEGPDVETGNAPDVRMAAAEAYAAAGVWHEALEIAIAMAQAEPNNEIYQQNLASLLSQVGLADAL